MKKITMTLIAIFICWASFVQAQENIVVKVNGKEIKTDFNHPFQYTTASGEKLNIEISQPDFLTYTDEVLSFQYAKDLSVSSSVIDEDIDMLMVMKTTGTGFMIQKYNSINPSGLNNFMLNEITKESINYGYTKTEKKFSKKLKDGKVLEGIQAILTYNGDQEVYTVSSYGEKDKGIIVVTMLLNDEFTSDESLIDLLFETLEIK